MFKLAMAGTDEDRSFVKLFDSQTSSKSFAFPVLFNEYLPDPLPITVELRDCSTRFWTVRMKKRGGTVFLTLGWENFVKDCNLEDGKWLNFIYDCNRTFYVIIFGLNGCSENREIPQSVMDVDDYAIDEEEEEEEEGTSN